MSDGAATRSASSCHVERLFRIPGVQSVRQSGDCTVCTSVVTPSTLVWGCAAANAKFHSPQTHDPVLIELDELEAEQSTCAVAFHSDDGDRARVLVKELLPSDTLSSSRLGDSWLLVLQGDMDGSVRYTLAPDARSRSQTVESDGATGRRSGTLVEMGEPVQFIVPFASTSSPRESSGVLVVGASGRARLLLATNRPASVSAPGIPIAFETPVQSVVFVAAMDCFVYSSRGVVFGFRVCELIARCSSTSSSVPTTLHTHFSTKLPFSVVRLRPDRAGALGFDWSLFDADGHWLSYAMCLVGRRGDRSPRNFPGTIACVHVRPSRLDESGLCGLCTSERPPFHQSGRCRRRDTILSSSRHGRHERVSHPSPPAADLPRVEFVRKAASAVGAHGCPATRLAHSAAGPEAGSSERYVLSRRCMLQYIHMDAGVPTIN